MEARAVAGDARAAESHWSLLDQYLRGRLRPDLYQRWFAPLRVVAEDGSRLQVSAPDRFHRDF
ncbi:MAG TPA: DnaA N-terminal domain-containing protein, partial [Anaeromyxobacteraceae bacterium]|nr:DnaA N-terminal domain-containing protein [Anaeromyxobacteraceae bacterium]